MAAPLMYVGIGLIKCNVPSEFGLKMFKDSSWKKLARKYLERLILSESKENKETDREDLINKQV